MRPNLFEENKFQEVKAEKSNNNNEKLNNEKDKENNLNNTLEKERRVTEREQGATDKKIDLMNVDASHNNIEGEHLNTHDDHHEIERFEMERPFSDMGDHRDFNERNLSLMDNLKIKKKIPEIPKSNLSNNEIKRMKQIMKNKPNLSNYSEDSN